MRVELPQVGESVTEGIIAKWLKDLGESVQKYEPLVEVVTDKVNMEVPSPVTGVLTVIFVEEGQSVTMGSVIAEIISEDEIAKQNNKCTLENESYFDTHVKNTTGILLKDVSPVGPTGSGHLESTTVTKDHNLSNKGKYSPVVKRLAREYNIDLNNITGTGKYGRVTRRDVQSVIDSRNTKVLLNPSETEGCDMRISLTPVRRTIAENMVKSVSLIPQAWTLIEVDATNLVNSRNSIKDDFYKTEGINITYMPFVVRALAETLREYPVINSSWNDNAILVRGQINIGIAVNTGDGLIVPVIHGADKLSLMALAKKIHEVAERARSNKLRLSDVQNGTFTLNNTGTLGSIASQPLVNYPQAGMLTTESIVKRPVVVRDSITIRSIMNITFTFDHRILDGADAAKFLNALKKRLEEMKVPKYP